MIILNFVVVEKGFNWVKRYRIILSNQDIKWLVVRIMFVIIDSDFNCVWDVFM